MTAKATKATKAAAVAANYEQLRTELEAIVSDLQRDDLDIDQALKHYERGLELVRQIDEYLNKAENRIRELKAAFEDMSGNTAPDSPSDNSASPS